MDSSDLLHQAIFAARNGDERRARTLFLDIVKLEPGNEIAWMWLSGLLESISDRISACEKVLTINPDNSRTRLYLNELEKKRSGVVGLNPRVISGASKFLISTNNNSPSRKYTEDDAVQLEEQGDLVSALEVYKILAAKTDDYREFDRIYHQIMRIENLQADNIKHVSSFASLVRLSIGWPILYGLLLLVQSGLKLFVWSTFYLWTGLIWVSIGSFLLALVEIRSHHMIWLKLFSSRSAGGSGIARFLVGAAGWFLISISFLILIIDSVNRLRNFDIPFPPY